MQKNSSKVGSVDLEKDRQYLDSGQKLNDTLFESCGRYHEAGDSVRRGQREAGTA